MVFDYRRIYFENLVVLRELFNSDLGVKKSLKYVFARISFKKAYMHTLAQLRSGELKGLKRVTISEGLRSFPEEIYELSDTLEILDLSNNALSSIPEGISRLKNLKIAFFSNNLFKEVPSTFKACENLYMLGFKANQIETFDEDILPLSISWLILTDNKIKILPKSIGKLQKLQKCALAGNHIREIPQEISACKNLELLRLSANLIEEIPESLLRLPKLSWLAFSGNPCSGHQEYMLENIAYEDIQIEELLGEGASGEIFRGYSKDLDREVAVKLFKGAVTSDGYAKDEMNAYMSTGEHENLIKVLAKIEDEKNLGLLLELIPQSFKALGNPPNFETCTRDTFAQGRSFTIESIHAIAAAIASAASHLHKRGLMHGDLYAHNILIDENDRSYLGDFGAASFYEDDTGAYEKIEIRAFGCLLDDLLSLCVLKEGDLYARLRKMSQACTHENIRHRPLFAELVF